MTDISKQLFENSPKEFTYGNNKSEDSYENRYYNLLERYNAYVHNAERTMFALRSLLEESAYKAEENRKAMFLEISSLDMDIEYVRCSLKRERQTLDGFYAKAFGKLNLPSDSKDWQAKLEIILSALAHEQNESLNRQNYIEEPVWCARCLIKVDESTSHVKNQTKAIARVDYQIQNAYSLILKNTLFEDKHSLSLESIDVLLAQIFELGMIATNRLAKSSHSIHTSTYSTTCSISDFNMFRQDKYNTCISILVDIKKSLKAKDSELDIAAQLSTVFQTCTECTSNDPAVDLDQFYDKFEDSFSKILCQYKKEALLCDDTSYQSLVLREFLLLLNHSVKCSLEDYLHGIGERIGKKDMNGLKEVIQIMKKTDILCTHFLNKGGDLADVPPECTFKEFLDLKYNLVMLDDEFAKLHECFSWTGYIQRTLDVFEKIHI